MTKLDQEVAKMALSEALEIANGATAPTTMEEQQQLLVAILKIKSLKDMITPALDKASKVLLKHAKNTKTTVEGSTLINMPKDGETVQMEVEMSFGPQTTVKDVIDWESIKADKHVEITDDLHDPKIKHISVGDVKDWDLFNAPSMQGNATAVVRAIAKHELDSKYQVSKTTSKYAIYAQTVEVADLK